MALHAELSGSSAYRWIKCPGSIKLCRTVPGRESGAAARQGTMAHAVAERILSGDPVSPTLTFQYVDHGQYITGAVDEEMLEHVMVYVDRVRHIAKSLKGKIHLEMHVSLKNLVRDRMWGTSDAVVDCSDKILYVVDYKHGYIPVHLLDPITGEPNSQLMYYAAGALDGFGWKHKTVFIEIVQPRSMEVEDVQSHGLPAEYVKKWAQTTLYDAAHATDEPDAPLVTGDHCRFCDALAVCPAVARMANETAGIDFMELTTTRTPQIPERPTDIARVLAAAPMIDAWLRACEERAFELLNTGKKVPGFKLVRKKSNRKWPTDDVDKLRSLLAKAAGKSLSRTAVYEEPKLLSPSKMEKVVGKEAVNRVAVKPDGGLTVAAESDLRSAVGPGADFEELGDIL